MRFLSFITPDYLMIVIMIYLNCRRREKGIQLLIILGVRRHFDCCVLFSAVLIIEMLRGRARGNCWWRANKLLIKFQEKALEVQHNRRL
jgi:hypothetical protein